VRPASWLAKSQVRRHTHWGEWWVSDPLSVALFGLGGLFDGDEAGKVFLFQAADPVAELSSFFEFKFLSGFAHLHFELAQHFGELISGFYISGSGVQDDIIERDGNVIGLHDACQVHIHGFNN
jgi:hypothetical protein